MGKYIIMELIPTSLDPKKGEVIQLSALKVDGIKLIDRFDYRISADKIILTDLSELISYDKTHFIYKNTTKEILDDFNLWCNNLKLLIIDNAYTLNYLSNFHNEKESFFEYLDMEYSDNVIDEMIIKYNLEPSNHIVDLLYEGIIKNNKEI